MIDVRDDIMYAQACTAVEQGSCVIMTFEGDIKYAGSIVGSQAVIPDKSGMCVIMNPDDYDKFATVVRKKQQ